MAVKNKIYFIILGLVGQLFFFGPIPTEPLRAGDNTFAQELSLPASMPERDRLILVSLFRLVVEGEISGMVAEYDDPTTESPADYLELYTAEGALLAFSWFDGFGIEWTAIDRGLLEDADELEGVFVLVLYGDSV